MSGVSPRALRYYEQQGLLTATRSSGGQREYTTDAVERVGWVQALFSAGLNSRQVLELLPCVHSGFTTPAMLDQLVTERDRIDAQIRELSGTRGRLDEVIEAARAALGPTEHPATAT